MRKIFFVILVLVSTTMTSFAQSKTPESVTTSFKQKFPKATHVKWDKENPHEYEASFKLDDTKYSANFSDTGEWLETENTISFHELPEKVQKAFSESHKGLKVKAAARIENSKGKTIYEIEFKKGLKTVEIFFDEAGIELNS